VTFSPRLKAFSPAQNRDSYPASFTVAFDYVVHLSGVDNLSDWPGVIFGIPLSVSFMTKHRNAAPPDIPAGIV